MLYASKGVSTLFTGQREKDKKRLRGREIKEREGEREKEGGRERKREGEREREGER